MRPVNSGATLSDVGFFDDVPLSPSPISADSLWDPPIAEFPRIAASALLLAQTEVVAIAVTAIWAFSVGFEFWIKAEFRHAAAAPVATHADSQSLRIGLLFADGRKVANMRSVPDPAGSPDTALILKPISFGGGPRHRDRSYWVWPLPKAGPVTFVCEWPAFAIPETGLEVDAKVILDAARQSVMLWPGKAD